MKFYTSIVHVDVSQEMKERAWKFAKEATPTTNYSDANQHIIAKIRNDHFVSKIGEEAVKDVMQQFAIVEGPDYTIYHGKEKSWQEDLFVNGIGLAVKTQTQSSANKYGLSWTFQCSSVRRDIILDHPDAWVVFVLLDDISERKLCKVYPPCQIKELVFGDPVLSHLKGHKKVVYASNLKP